VVTCTATRRWRWYQRAFIASGLGGGLLLLLAAAIASNGASVPLLIFGGGYACIGGAVLWHSRRVAHEMRLDDGQVTFVFPGRELRIAAGDVLSFRRGRLDPSRLKPMLVRTGSHGTIKVSSRLTGLFDFLYGLRQVNPGVLFPDL
jgi:hypothetical protein